MTDYRPWTPDEDAALLAGRRSGMTYLQLSVSLPGRSKKAVERRLKRLPNSATYRKPVPKKRARPKPAKITNIERLSPEARGSRQLLEAMFTYFERRQQAA